MPSFSNRSKQILTECDPRLQIIMNLAIHIMDFSVLSGKRGEIEQNALYDDGKTKLKYPNSYHNNEPFSNAVDIAPYPIDWNDAERFILLAGIVIGISELFGHKVTWGGDWDRDFEVKDNNFDDLGHFQIED